jgi:hypothetical protein
MRATVVEMKDGICACGHCILIAMSRNLAQPVNQKKLTNVVVIRLKKAGFRFEIAAYPNKVEEYRKKMYLKRRFLSFLKISSRPRPLLGLSEFLDFDVNRLVVNINMFWKEKRIWMRFYK